MGLLNPWWDWCSRMFKNQMQFSGSEMRPLMVIVNSAGLLTGIGLVEIGSRAIRNIPLEFGRRALSAWS
jgi:hypothetical protein